MSIDFYYMLPSPPCRAVMMAAKHFNVDLNMIVINLAKGEQNEEWFKKINPQHTVPTINDNGFTLWESRAIMTYLANQYAPTSSLYPKDPAKRAVIDRVLQFDQSTFYQRFGEYMAVPIIKQGKKMSDLDPEKEVRAKEAFKMFDNSLANQKYAAGNELTLADLSMLASLTMIEGFSYDMSEYKNITEWANRAKSELPYYDEINKEAMEMFKGWIAMKLAEAEKKA